MKKRSPQSQRSSPSQPQSPSPSPPSRSKSLPLLLVALVIVSILAVSVHLFRPEARRAGQGTRQSQPGALPTPPAPPVQQPQHAHQHDQPPPVTPEERLRFIDSLRSSFIVEECCASTIDNCVRQKPQCAVAPRLAVFMQWLDSIGQTNPGITNERIADELHKRYASLASKQSYTVDPAGWPLIGDPKAPVTIGMYYAGTCPVCKTNYRELHDAVTNGSLKGKAKIVAKPYTTGIVNRALIAAQDMGRFSDYMLEMARRGGRMDTAAVYAIAEALLLNNEKFEAIVESQSVMTRAEQATKEGEANGVSLVPTYFINGRRYESLVAVRWVIDAVEFEYETISRK